MSLLKLAINRQTRQLVSYAGSATALPDLFQGNVQDFQIQFVDPDPTGSPGRYTAADLGTSGLRVSIGATPTGTAGGPTPLALQTSWTWSAAQKYFTGSLELTSSSIDSHIGGSAQATAYFEVNLTTAGNRITLYQQSFVLKAVVDEQSSTTPAPSDQYLTKAECLALFAKFINDAGQTVVLKSANGTYGAELKVNDDGTFSADVIVL